MNKIGIGIGVLALLSLMASNYADSITIQAYNMSLVPMHIVGNSVDGFSYAWTSPNDPSGLGIRSSYLYSCVYYLGVFYGQPLYFEVQGWAC